MNKKCIICKNLIWKDINNEKDYIISFNCNNGKFDIIFRERTLEEKVNKIVTENGNLEDFEVE